MDEGTEFSSPYQIFVGIRMDFPFGSLSFKLVPHAVQYVSTFFSRNVNQITTKGTEKASLNLIHVGKFMKLVCNHGNKVNDGKKIRV